VTRQTMPVVAQWALHGKKGDVEGYHILACSTGDLTVRHFEEAIGRFQLGALDTLPQVSVSYLRHGTQPGINYLALAIHWFAEEGQRYADGVLQLDNEGRHTAFTSYFCVPYRGLDAAAITYLDLYEALSDVTLPVVSGPQKKVTIETSAQRPLAIDNLALRVAPLLLTGQPVCVLGAERTSMIERLRFIDGVMALLPYGLRARMTAATWTRATYREHRFRLFFSSSPRASEQPDHVVTWGEPYQVRIPGGPPGDYFDWLTDMVGPLERLPEITTEIGFGPKPALQAYNAAVGALPRPRPTAASQADSGSPPPLAAPRSADFGEDTLMRCAEDARNANLTRIKSDIIQLQNFAKADEIDDSRRMRYRELITRHELLRPNHLVGKQEGRLYDALLALAFGTPLTYDGYCLIEDCLGIQPGEPPHKTLLEAIERDGMTGPVTAGIVYWHLSATDEKKLNKWLVSGAVDAVDLIRLLARDWHSTQHARIICDLTLDYLTKASGRYKPLKVRDTLLKYGFLASALHRRHPDKDQYQISALYQFLKAAYASGIDRTDIIQILAGNTSAPTPALLAAVLMHLSRPGDWQLAHQAYAHGSLTMMKTDPTTTLRLQDRAPAIPRASITA